MRTERYYDDILEHYLLSENSFKNPQKSIEYSNGDFYGSMGNLYTSIVTLLPWGQQPSDRMLNSTEFLFIEPPEEYLYIDKRPEFIKDFQKLIALDMPLIYALSLNDDSLPNSVTNLTLINDREQTDCLGTNKREMKNNLLFPNFSYPNIKGLNLVTSSSAELIADGYLNISEHHFPNLEFLRCCMCDKDKYSLLDKFPKLKHLWVTINNRDSLFNQIKSPLQSLYIDGCGKDLNIQEIQNIPSLEILHINSCYNTIDCTNFQKMPKLKEIRILNSKQVTNIETLLDMPTLKSLDILDCKGAFTKEQKVRFYDKVDKFELLSIEYA